MILILQNSLNALQFFFGKLQIVQRSQVRLQLFDAAGSDQRRGDLRLAQHPGERHLRQRLPALPGKFIQFLDFWQVLLHILGRQPDAFGFRGARTLRDAVQIPVSQLSLCERRKNDAANPFTFERIQQAIFDPAVEHTVPGLVDQAGRAQIAQDLGSLAGLFR